MFETRSRAGRLVLTAVLAVMVIPFIIPLFTMVQGSLQGSGWANYRTVRGLHDRHRLLLDAGRRVRLLEAARPRQGTVLLADDGGPDDAGGGAADPAGHRGRKGGHD